CTITATSVGICEETNTKPVAF
ncbi:hypothetical protein NPIL_124381, partial [Nephila pilipes]